MNIQNTIADRLGRKIYFDANLYIYAFEGFAEDRPAVPRLFAMLDTADVQVIASEVVLAELLPKPLAEGKSDLAEAYLEFLEGNDQIDMVPLDRSIILAAIDLRARHRLKSMDAFHLATAIETGCTSFISNDRQFPKLDDIAVFDLTEDFADLG